MPHHRVIEIQGRVTDVFAHRFVIETASGQRRLADMGPKGLEVVSVKPGDTVSIKGEEHPSEIKVLVIARDREPPVDVPRAPKHGPKHEGNDADPVIAIDAVKTAGAAVLGEAIRHPKHFEVLGQKANSYVEYHVEFDGHIRKERPVSTDDKKWAEVIGH